MDLYTIYTLFSLTFVCSTTIMFLKRKTIFLKDLKVKRYFIHLKGFIIQSRLENEIDMFDF